MSGVRETTCEYCGLAIRPGEEHGIIGTGEPLKGETVGEPRVICKIKKVVQVAEVIETEIETVGL